MLEISHLRYDVTDEEGMELGILRDVNLTVDDGKLVVITGPNGGGKTTLARAIMGLNQPTAGSIRWNGQDITDLSITDRARAGVSYGFQQPPRFKGMKVRDLIALAAGKEDLTPGEGCQYLTRWACAPTTISSGRWTPASPAVRSSASRSPPFWPGRRG